MPRIVGIGHQDFEQMITSDNFYIDKTMFIKEWWESKDRVTLITRPRRFGKTLNMSMLEKFFSVKYADRGDLFEGLLIWEDETYQQLQGMYPVVFISFAGIKENTFSEARKSMCRTIEEQYNKNDYLLKGSLLNDREKEIIEWRYGLHNQKPVTQREIADKLGISRSYVSRIEKRALEKLKECFE